jgi:hypothetical protein
MCATGARAALRRAIEQYNEVDPRNRLVAAELEEVEQLKAEMEHLAAETQELTAEEEQELLSLGRRFPEVWESEAATPEAKKRIIRTVIETIMVDLDNDTEKLTFTVHWKGGNHTQYRMAKPVSGRGNRWNEQRVAAVRCRYQIDRHRRKPSNRELLPLGEEAAYCGVSPTTIKRLVEAGILTKDQIVPWAPWAPAIVIR